MSNESEASLQSCDLIDVAGVPVRAELWRLGDGAFRWRVSGRPDSAERTTGKESTYRVIMGEQPSERHREELAMLLSRFESAVAADRRQIKRVADDA